MSWRVLSVTMIKTVFSFTRSSSFFSRCNFDFYKGRKTKYNKIASFLFWFFSIKLDRYIQKIKRTSSTSSPILLSIHCYNLVNTMKEFLLMFSESDYSWKEISDLFIDKCIRFNLTRPNHFDLHARRYDCRIIVSLNLKNNDFSLLAIR